MLSFRSVWCFLTAIYNWIKNVRLFALSDYDCSEVTAKDFKQLQKISFLKRN